MRTFNQVGRADSHLHRLERVTDVLFVKKNFVSSNLFKLSGNFSMQLGYEVRSRRNMQLVLVFDVVGTQGLKIREHETGVNTNSIPEDRLSRGVMLYSKR